mgnify:FL=1
MPVAVPLQLSPAEEAERGIREVGIAREEIEAVARTSGGASANSPDRKERGE